MNSDQTFESICGKMRLYCHYDRDIKQIADDLFTDAKNDDAQKLIDFIFKQCNPDEILIFLDALLLAHLHQSHCLPLIEYVEQSQKMNLVT